MEKCNKDISTHIFNSIVVFITELNAQDFALELQAPQIPQSERPIGSLQRRGQTPPCHLNECSMLKDDVQDPQPDF